MAFRLISRLHVNLIAGMLLASPTLFASSNLDCRSRLAAGIQALGHAQPEAFKALSSQSYYPAILRVADDSAIAEMEENGCKILRRRDDLVLAYIPTDQVGWLSTFSRINSASLGNRNIINMDLARPMARVDEAVAPTVEYPNGWDGTGVVVGFCDTGFEPHHPNFLDKDGNTRVRKIVAYRDTLAVEERAETLAEIASWTMDDITENHATHVAGIMAGGYGQYHGVATGADIVATTSMLTDACILAGAEEILDYAREQGQPAVINMSVGSYTGPHDGSSLFCQYLDLIGQEAVVCISAGNEGNGKNSLQLTFDEEHSEYSTFLCEGWEWHDRYVYGPADFWSVDSRPFGMRIELFDCTNKSVVFSSPVVGNGEEGQWIVSSQNYGIDGAQVSSEMANWGTGYLALSYGTDPENGRYNVAVQVDFHNRYTRENEIGRCYIRLVVIGDPGVEVDGYAHSSANYFNWGYNSGMLSGNSSQSISNIATGYNVITVGACSSRNEWPLLSGGTKGYDYTVGNIASFSGYGTLRDGRKMPHISGPGNYVVSSYPSYTGDVYPSSVSHMVDAVTIDGRTYYWGAECGTSMSSPLVGGVAALMLQANPSLSPAEVRNIILDTANTSFDDIDDPRWGEGCVDAQAAVSRAMASSNVGSVLGSTPQPVVNRQGDIVTVTIPGDDRPLLRLFTIDGRQISASHDFVHVGNLPSGLYLLATPISTHKLRL
ncbi:MAG: S8 family serine peptidase [Bacteroidales bacterium]|nr:S8 family serine peptidase [Bacteroidales bacterium]